MTEATVYADFVEFSHHAEAGNCMTGECPQCGQEVTVCEAGWASIREGTTCECGLAWYLDETLVGVADE